MNNSENTNTSRTRQLYPRIVSKAGILYGKPVIEGTRLSVEAILQNLASGYTRDDLLDAYPFLTPEDITAAIEYAARLAANPPSSSDDKERAVS
ncbi:MAG TPA: DUF433 domain-containing protein [Ktedonobacteraceae bacterium]|nr:DUF433 domain-containing protein [Ktedonobacteraceae bacterium]